MIDQFSPTLSYYIVQNAPGTDTKYAFGIKTAGYRCSYFIRTGKVLIYDPATNFLNTLFESYKLQTECNTEEYKRFVLSIFKERAFIMPAEEIFHLPLCFTLQ
ncbi:hypothetical protein [Rheinheimera salexigens]|uniref:Uncharacterized protein n=1 Tax=Rheinheimera salexigens TaxID=1628148 RepID=A0A1E7Q7N9_9GAMM|nr:hypothetical protein [Rheinheimera salexigens]OEY70093.1 hypothetical protein BI198_11335 [Rheinheimera salexigens]